MPRSPTISLPQLGKGCMNTLRGPAVHMVRVANAGHPELPLGSAGMVSTLWDRLFTCTVGDVCQHPHPDVLRPVRETP